MKMDKEEVRQEHKGQEVSAEVRGAIRRRQMQAARARMMAAVSCPAQSRSWAAPTRIE